MKCKVHKTTETDNMTYAQHYSYGMYKRTNASYGNMKQRPLFRSDQLLFIENKPKKKIGFMAKEKWAEYGKDGKRKKERNA